MELTVGQKIGMKKVAVALLFMTGIPVLVYPELFLFVLEDYYFAIVATVLFIGTILISGFKKPIQISITALDIAILLFGFYCILNFLFVGQHTFIVKFVVFILQGALYFGLKQLFSQLRSFAHIADAILFASMVEIVSGYLQVFGIIQNMQPNMPLGGSFANPGPFAVFLACVLPMALYNFMQTDPRSVVRKIWYGLFYLLAFGLVIVSKSRSAVIASVIGSVVVLLWQFRLIAWFSKQKTVAKTSIILGLLACTIGASAFLFTIKKDSALGRVFIWKNCVQAIAEAPVFGTGMSTFMPSYNKAQAETFANGNYTEQEFLLAGDVKMAYNDFLQITIEYGIIGTILFLFIVAQTAHIAIRWLSQHSSLIVPLASMAALLSAGLFAYPLTILKLQVLFLVCVAFVSSVTSYKGYTITLNGTMTPVLKSVVLLFVCVFAWKTSTSIYALNRWNNAIIEWFEGDKRKAIRELNSLETELLWNEVFYYNYASVLLANKDVKKALQLYKKYESNHCSFDLSESLGNLYYQIGDYQNAVVKYQLASNIIPSRFIPRYRLMQSFIRLQQYSDAVAVAHTILEMPVKIYDARVEAIQNEAKNFLNIK